MNVVHIIFSCSLPYQEKISKNFKLGHSGLGVVINKNTIIGANCKIVTNGSIGGTSKKEVVPRLGNRVYVATGTKTPGPITIGSDVTIGANSMVINDAPSQCVVAGIPAKIIKQGINFHEYI